MDEFENKSNDNLNSQEEFSEHKKQFFNKKLFKKITSVLMISIIAFTVTGFGIGFIFNYSSNIISKLNYKNSSKNTSEISAIDAQPVISASNDSYNAVNIIKKVKPSVVCITSKVQEQSFFNMVYESEGSGSGIIFYEDADNVYIVTNYHVVEGAAAVGVSIENSDLSQAKLIGKDTQADLAVISVSKEELKNNGIDSVTVATFGDSDKLEMGESVIAIGNALGQGNTATAGIISAVQKNINIDGRKLHVIQTDAAINPGNSGGALVNAAGEVIGINTAKFAKTSVEGVGYSITSNIAKPIIEQLMNKSDAPSLGVYISNVTEEMAQAYNLPQMGVLIQQIIPGGSAANSDLQASDIITGFNDQPIFNTDQLIEAVRKCSVGDTVELKVLRNGANSTTVKVKLLKSQDTSF